LVLGSRNYAKQEIKGIVKEQAQEVVDHPETVIRHTNDVVGAIFKTGVEVMDASLGLTLEEERDLGKILSEALQKKLVIVDDREQLARIQALADMFLKERKENVLNYTFKIVDTPEVNAYALCGGFIQITTGMLKAAGDDNNALAFIIGHEIGHVINGHCAKSMIPLVRMGNLAGEEAAVLSNAAFQIIGRGYSELDEYEADLWSCTIMCKNGISKQNRLAGIRLLLKEEQARKENAAAGSKTHARPRVMENRESRVASEILTQMEKYWATHPNTQSRFERLDAVE
jgi:predicted Zn-dependent protease